MMTDADTKMLAQPVSEWPFDFWKRQVEEAPDVSAATGRLYACSELQSRFRTERLFYLMDLADWEVDSLKPGHLKVLSGHAYKLLAKFLEEEYLGWEKIKYMPAATIDKVLWFFRPDRDFTAIKYENSGLKFQDSFNGWPSDTVSKSLRRTRGQLSWSCWRGEMRHATHAHKVQVLRILYATGRLSELIPSASSCHYWNDFEDVLPEVEALARKEMELFPSTWEIQSIEEAAYWKGPASMLMILLKAVLPAGKGFYERSELKRLRRNAAA